MSVFNNLSLYIRCMKLTHLSFLLIACALSLPVAAQKAPAAASSAAVAAPTAGQRQAAEAFLNTMYSEESFNQLIEQTLATQLKLHPEAQAYETEMRAFFRKYLNWASLKPDMVEIYAREFTEPELRELTRFYQTPTGRKAAAKMPTLMQTGMEMGQRRVQEHLPELQKVIMEKAGK